jgi:para-aminobenzoate synthetase component I
MVPHIEEVCSPQDPEALAQRLRGEQGLILLRSGGFDPKPARYSFLVARPFLGFQSFGSRCEVRSSQRRGVQFGNPWQILSDLVARYELLTELDCPFPLGGCFGFWGYDLKRFTEPKLCQRAVNDLDLPDCQVGFYDSLVVFDHQLAKTWIVSTGLQADGSQSRERAQRRSDWWRSHLLAEPASFEVGVQATAVHYPVRIEGTSLSSTLTRDDFLQRVELAQRYIRRGDIYQVNLSHRLSVPAEISGWDLFRRLRAVSPAPFSAFLDWGDYQICSSSPELFLRVSGAQVQTRPIKGTRARSPDPIRDAQLGYELQTSAKENAELVMITDLLRNDLGRCCEFGTVHTPDLLRLERFAQVQHLVSTVEGRLRSDVDHLALLAACFPGGSVTGAPKFRAMQIIDELEPTSRGPYTGALGYIGFNRESQLSIIIRAALCIPGTFHFPVGAGIVADSDATAEYRETIAKAEGFFEALPSPGQVRRDLEYSEPRLPTPQTRNPEGVIDTGDED